METQEFQRLIDKTIESLPPQFREKLEGVAVCVEPLPGSHHGVRKGSRSLLGLYEGVPFTEWNRDFSGKLLDKITLFQQNIEEFAESPDEIPHVIRETLLHEIGHHFGLDHDRIGKMEKRWKAARLEKP